MDTKNLKYTKSGDGYTVSGLRAGGTGGIWVPSKYRGENVLGVEAGAFKGREDVTSVTMDEGVTFLGVGAFEGCVNLKRIKIPKTLTDFGERAFSGCASLSVVDIEDVASWCGADFGYEESNPLCSAHLFLRGEPVTFLEIPEGIECVGEEVFADCHSLLWVTLPKSLGHLRSGAFRRCGSLAYVFYGGSRKDWERIDFAAGWSFSDRGGDGPVICFYSRDLPAVKGNFWHRDFDGVPRLWQ